MPTMTDRSPQMYDRAIRGAKAWTRKSLRREDYLLPIPEDCLGEIATLVETLRANPLQTEVLTPQDFHLPRTRTFMREVKRRLDRGCGFVVLDRLPVKSYNKDELRTVYWVLSWLIARPVAQSFSGTLLYDVIDTGKKKSPTVRADLTNQELDFHTDYSYNCPPRYFGLQVLRTARKGGRSSAVSLYTAHNVMRREHPDLLARLYRPFWLNRYGEHAPGLPPASRHPVFAWDGRELWARFNPRNIHAGYDLMGETLDDAGRAAVETLHRILADPANHIDFDLKPGQTAYFLNGQCAHRRTDYEDWDEPDRKRHMIRIFLRDEGARTYDG